MCVCVCVCLCVCVCSQEDGVHLLLQELRRGLEDSGRRRAAADLIGAYAAAKKNSPAHVLEYMEQLLDVSAHKHTCHTVDTHTHTCRCTPALSCPDV